MQPRTSALPALISISAWLALALVAGASGRLATLPFPVPQSVLLGLAVVAVVAGTSVAALRAWLDAVDLRALVGVHAVRLVAGSYFLYLSGQGQLSAVFATRAGWGDIAVAVWAVVVVLSGLPATRRHRGPYLAWNAFGLLDFALVVWTAVSVGRPDPAALAVLLRLPLSLLPTFVVPLLIASHVFIFQRLAALARQEGPPAGGPP
ncbi:MAG: hypothetical protein ACREMR_03860 [Gemmatimonadales bacterium]